MKPIKKSHQPIIKKSTIPEPPQQNPVDDVQPIKEDLQPVATEDQAPEYIPGYVPFLDNPPVQSVKGLQIAEGRFQID